jgi:hypothetical protein
MLKKRLSDAWSLLATVSLTLLLNATAFGQGVVIHLKNGDRISGTILSETPSAVRLTNSFLGAFEVPVAEIAKREAQPAPVAAVITNAPVVAVSTNLVPAKTNVVVAAPPKEPKPPLSPANPEATPIASTPSHWKHDLRFGVNLRYATKDSHEFLSLLKSTYGKQPFRHIFDVNFKYGRVEGALSANSLAASEKTEYQLSPKSYVFGLIGGGYD